MMFTCPFVDLVAVAHANNPPPLTVHAFLSVQHVVVTAHVVVTVMLLSWTYILIKDVYSKMYLKGGLDI